MNKKNFYILLLILAISISFVTADLGIDNEDGFLNNDKIWHIVLFTAQTIKNV